MSSTTQNESLKPESQQSEPLKRPNPNPRLRTDSPIPNDHRLFEGAKIVIVEGDVHVAQNYPKRCEHYWKPDGITLDTDVLFIEDITCIPIQCEDCGVGTNLDQNCTLSNGKIS